MFDYIRALDRQGFCFIAGMTHKHGLHSLGLRLSASGDGHLYLYLSVGLLLTQAQGQHFFNLVLAGFLVELPLYLLLKNSIRRPRPCHVVGAVALFEPSDKFSLPSGHTAAAFVLAFAVLTVYPAFALLAYAWAGLIGLSRIVLGVHYPLDIVAGACLGTGAGLFALQFI
ncbi:phosphatase PAP2 family protein [Shewanella sp. AS16]|uniref:phosphatase PAP2 family protein n=1 Tax=Shewanella sp. AS16 TaxID=2907625 RepID=UPI001F41F79D|nr:phosphatase PAP2 family protein [Shewanella sp. AS16]MCE9685940.1 phosphatase PAP2 family protein [Shewanella sp. AS16]